MIGPFGIEDKLSNPAKIRIHGLARRLRKIAPDCVRKRTELCGGKRQYCSIAASLKTRTTSNESKAIMLYTVAVVLIILWLLGLVSSYTMGGLIHLLLVIAIAVILLRIISGRKPL